MRIRLPPATWVIPILAALGFVTLAVVFGLHAVDFRREVELWARRDLSARAALTAETLREPLETQDFRRISEVARGCREQGLGLLVLTSRGGRVYDASTPGPTFRVEVPCAEWRIFLDMPLSRVNLPFVRAVRGFALAFLGGLAGMFLVFHLLYRQRVRIRELKRLESFRRDFIADVSHEIKTPLTGILGAADLLGDATDATRPRLVAMIVAESRRLNALAQDVLTLSRLEREGWQLDCAPVDLAALVRETVERFAAEAQAAGVELHAVGADGDGPVVTGDGRLLSQALANLVSNALRHSGSPEVIVSLAAVGDEVELAVEDHGKGIPAEHAARVFERFHRVDPSRDSATGGAGLGLAIVHRIAVLHGGEATLSAVRPHGCRFTLHFRPVASASMRLS